MEYKILPEWYPHHSTWTTYPQNPETFFDKLDEAKDVFVKMVKLISEGEKVYINVDDEIQKRDLIARLEKFNVSPKNIQINIIPTNDAWHRDYGAIVVKDQNQKPVGLNFRFNSWGGKYPYELDDKVASKMCETLGIPEKRVDMVLEGGAIDTNGEVLITTESCLLNPNRNPHLTKDQIEGYLKNLFGVKKIIWLKEGIVGDDTDGHVDDITRFVNENTIITAVENNSNDKNFEPLQKNLEILKKENEKLNNRFTIETLPMPEPQYYDFPFEKNYRLPASYANFYITNKYMIIPTFNCPQDKEAIDKLQRIFLDKEVVGLYAYPIIVGLGAFHCLTMQVPRL